jgi:myo-inositol-1(or 4)-monophosphatase
MKLQLTVLKVFTGRLSKNFNSEHYTMEQINEFKSFLHELIIKAGDITLDYRTRLSSIEVQKKSAKDFVTAADVATENFIVDCIKQTYPEHSIYGEETGKHSGNEYRWVIDPIDGTTSFMKKHPFYGVSIALQKNEQTIVAAVNAPVLGELFEAQFGCGAFLNGEPIQVSPETELVNSVLGTGFACVRAGLEHDNMPLFTNVVRKIRGVRRFGSCSIDLSYVACGRFEGFWELNLYPYDVAAGTLIVTEAGGMVTDFEGKQNNPCQQIVATNTHIHKQLLNIIVQTDY